MHSFGLFTTSNRLLGHAIHCIMGFGLMDNTVLRALDDAFLDIGNSSSVFSRSHTFVMSPSKSFCTARRVRTIISCTVLAVAKIKPALTLRLKVLGRPRTKRLIRMVSLLDRPDRLAQIIKSSHV